MLGLSKFTKTFPKLFQNTKQINNIILHKFFLEMNGRREVFQNLWKRGRDSKQHEKLFIEKYQLIWNLKVSWKNLKISCSNFIAILKEMNFVNFQIKNAQLLLRSWFEKALNIKLRSWRGFLYPFIKMKKKKKIQ